MRWIVTFSDLVTLMLVFFVMLFSVSSIDVAKFKKLLSPISKREINIEPSEIAKPEQIFNIENQNEVFSDDGLDYIYHLLRLRIQESKALKDLNVSNHGKYLKLTLPSDVVFESNSVELKKEGKKLFTDILLQLVNLNNQLSFIAYSDPRPIISGGYETNEKLSLGRAMSVANLSKQMGYARNPMILLGGTKAYAQTDKNLSDAERYDLSRKVDIIVYTTQLSQQELYLLPNV